jgi:5-formyltetrahydrofolate cyclo-ligase
MCGMDRTADSSPKRALRESLRARRLGLVARLDRAAESAALADHVVTLVTEHGITPGDTVAVYESLPSEPPLEEVCRRLQARGIRTIAPITLPSWELDWFDLADPARTPLGTGSVASSALVLAPALAVDRAGTRLGQGGGCYDRTLPLVAAGTTVVAVLHPGELTDDLLPRAAHDLPVDAVLTADGVTVVG